jgi:hypothetical protein
MIKSQSKVISAGKKNMIARLDEIMQVFDMSDSQLAVRLGYTPTNFRKYLRGTVDPENVGSKLIGIGVSSDWFFTGNGPMLIKDSAERSPNDKMRERIGELIAEAVRLSVELSTGGLAEKGVHQELLAPQQLNERTNERTNERPTERQGDGLRESLAEKVDIPAG